MSQQIAAPVTSWRASWYRLARASRLWRGSFLWRPTIHRKRSLNSASGILLKPPQKTPRRPPSRTRRILSGEALQALAQAGDGLRARQVLDFENRFGCFRLFSGNVHGLSPPRLGHARRGAVGPAPSGDESEIRLDPEVVVDRLHAGGVADGPENRLLFREECTLPSSVAFPRSRWTSVRSAPARSRPPLEGLLDRLADFGGVDPGRVHDDVVDHAPGPPAGCHAARSASSRSGSESTVPSSVTHPLATGRADLRVRNEHVPFERVFGRRARRSVSVRVKTPGSSDFDVVGDVEHSATRCARGFPCREFLCKLSTVPDRATMPSRANGDADFGLWGGSTFPPKLAKDVFAEICVSVTEMVIVAITPSFLSSTSAPTAVSANHSKTHQSDDRRKKVCS